MGTSRLQQLRALISKEGMDVLLVSQQENRRYLSGFTGSSGWLFVSQHQAILATDFRYTEQAGQESHEFEILQTTGALSSWFAKLAMTHGWRRLGFDAENTSFAIYQQLSNIIKDEHLALELIPSRGIVKKLRSIKDQVEIRIISKAVELTDAAFNRALTLIRPGITEKELAWEIECFFRQNGAEGMAFDIIVATGPNSALPHASPGNRQLQPGEPILIDMGARIDGYCGDFTRTVCLGKADERLQQIYNIVLDAQQSAIKRIKSGMSGAEADMLARSVIEQAGYGDAFGHGLGHGIGLEIHESPSLSRLSTDILSNDMIFSIEPGIYIPGYGGVRIEDTVILEEGTIKVLTKSAKQLLF
jgi:Xaa-Pro aminopeptidase